MGHILAEATVNDTDPIDGTLDGQIAVDRPVAELARAVALSSLRVLRGTGPLPRAAGDDAP